MWSLKTLFISEDYLSVKQEHHCKALAKIRISAHWLAIERGRYTTRLIQVERGRYTTPLNPVENRTCNNCLEDIENEYHFLIDCKTYCIESENLYKCIVEKCTLFTSLDNKGKFIYMLSAGVDIAELIAKCIYHYLP